MRRLLNFIGPTARRPKVYAKALTQKGELRDHYIMVRGSASSDQTWIVFSHVRIPEGQFAQSRVFSHLNGASLFLNCADNSWFDRGVPGAASSLSGLADWVEEVLTGRDLGKLTIVGHSMGAYAALALSARFPQARFVATSPELTLGDPGSRSRENGIGPNDAQGSLYDFIPHRDCRAQSMTLFGAWDPADARFLARRETYDGRFGRIYPVAYHHGVTEYLTKHRFYLSLLRKGNRYARALRRNGAIMPVPTVEDRKRYQGFAALNDAIEAGDLETFSRLARRNEDWENPGWFQLASKGAWKFDRKKQALFFAARAARIAPTVSDYPLHYARIAVKLDDSKASNEAIGMLESLHVRHRSVDAFLASLGNTSNL